MPPEFFHDITQNSDQWIEIRRGIPTASNFATILANGRGGSDSKTRRTYMHKLAGEIITGQPAESFSNGYTDRGHAMEAEARSAYSFQTDRDPEAVGFVRNGRVGASPDSLIGADGLLEIKTKAPHILIDTMFRDDFPPEHIAQVQGQLWVCEREWCDLAVYYTGMPLLVFRAHRDEAYIAGLSRAVAAFTDELDALVMRVRGYDDPEVLRAAFRESAA